jgi:hypothetical protein
MADHKLHKHIVTNYVDLHTETEVSYRNAVLYFHKFLLSC